MTVGETPETVVEVPETEREDETPHTVDVGESEIHAGVNSDEDCISRMSKAKRAFLTVRIPDSSKGDPNHRDTGETSEIHGELPEIVVERGVLVFGIIEESQILWVPSLGVGRTSKIQRLISKVLRSEIMESRKEGRVVIVRVRPTVGVSGVLVSEVDIRHSVVRVKGEGNVDYVS